MIYIWTNFLFLVILSSIIFIITRSKSLFPSVVLKHNLIYFFSPLILGLLNFILFLVIDKKYIYFAVLYLTISLAINIYSRLKLKNEINNEKLIISKVSKFIYQYMAEKFFLEPSINIEKRHGINSKKTVIIKFHQVFDEVNLSEKELKDLQKIISSELDIFVEIQFQDIILKENSYIYERNNF